MKIKLRGMGTYINKIGVNPEGLTPKFCKSIMRLFLELDSVDSYLINLA